MTTKRESGGQSDRLDRRGRVSSELTWSVDFSNASPLVNVDPTASLIESKLRMICRMSEMTRSSLSSRSLCPQHDGWMNDRR